MLRWNRSRQSLILFKGQLSNFAKPESAVKEISLPTTTFRELTRHIEVGAETLFLAEFPLFVQPNVWSRQWKTYSAVFQKGGGGGREKHFTTLKTFEMLSCTKMHFRILNNKRFLSDFLDRLSHNAAHNKRILSIVHFQTKMGLHWLVIRALNAVDWFVRM